MSKKPKVLTYFSAVKDEELMVLSYTVINAMEGNPNFPNPSPGLLEIQELLNAFINKLKISRKRGSPEDTAAKNESRIPLVDQLKRLSYYVNTTSKGQLSVLLSSGFPTTSMSNSSLVPTRVEKITLTDGRQSGQIRLDFIPQKETRIYEYCYKMVEGNDLWSDRMTTTSSKGNIIAPLVVGNLYEVKVRGVNRQGAGDWSNTVSIMAR